MPMRDYKCRVCSHTWEELRKGQTDPERCPMCKTNAVSRKLSAPGGFTFTNGNFSASSEKRK